MFNWDNYLDSLETKKIGIINVTNDSFSGDGIYVSQEKLQSKFEIAKKRNIKLLDVGCMSTKPKFQTIDTNEESKRLDFFLENISEDYDYFNNNQMGASSMPHKKNPILSENLTGLARMIRSYVTPALELSLIHI